MTKFTRFKMLLMALVMLVGSGNVWGQILTFEFSALAGDEVSASSNFNNANITTSSITRGAGLTASANGGRYNATSWALTSIDNAVAGNKYMQITISPNSGYQFSISSIYIQLQRSGTGPSAIALRSSVDNFATNLDQIYTITDNTSTQNFTFTFAQAASTTPVTYRFYMYAEAAGGTGGIGDGTGNDIVVSGVVSAVGGNPVVSTPSFDPSSGTYYSAQNVSLSSTEGSTIYYTTDGSDPDNTDTQYSTPIAVSTTTTIKAKAYKDGMDPSGIASATYTFPTINNVSNIAALRAGLTDGTVYKLTGEAVLTLKTASRNAKYIQDATGAVLIDDNGGVIKTGYNIGDGITGITGTLALYNAMLQFTPVADPGAATSTGNVITPATVDLSNIGDYEAKLVKVSGVTINGTGNFASGSNYNLNGGSNPIIRTQYYDLDYINTAIPTVPQDIVGVVLKNNSINQLVPRSLAEMTNTVFSTPTILVSESTVPAMTAFTGGGTDTETITVNAQNLTANISIELSGTNQGLFSLSTSSITPISGSVTDQLVTITYAPNEVGSHTATLTLKSIGAEDVVLQLSGTATVPPTVPNVIITEVYGGGGNSGATLKQDFIELYNTTENSVVIGGWSVQYYSSTGTGAASESNTFVIPEGKYIPPFKHFLIQAAAGTGGTQDIENPDAISTLALAGTNGKVILYSVSNAQTITAEISSITDNANFKDYVPFGNATPVWGSSISSLTSTTSASRKKIEGVYTYSQNIGNDFEVVTPSPENTGLSTSVNNPLNSLNITAFDGKIRFSATAGQQVEVYNAVGQKLMSATTLDGLNTLSVNAKGMMIVKVGDRLAKVIL